MENLILEKPYKIIDIKKIKEDNTYETRTDDLYPQRIESIVNFYLKPLAGSSCCMNYLFDNQGNEKTGTIITSNVIDVDVSDSVTHKIMTIYTLNSVYILEEVE